MGKPVHWKVIEAKRRQTSRMRPITLAEQKCIKAAISKIRIGREPGRPHTIKKTRWLELKPIARELAERGGGI
jgi:hypothetical protein